MELINGIQIRLQDLKTEENGKLTLFIQLEDLIRKNHQATTVVFNNIFDQFDSLIFTPEDEIRGVSKGKAIIIEKITGAFKTVQQMFASA